MYERIVTPTWEPPADEQAKVVHDPDGKEVEKLYRKFLKEGFPQSIAFLKAIVDSPTQSVSVRRQAAQSLKDHESPKLSASTLVTYDGDFAARLDLAIERARNGTKVIGHQSLEGSSPEGPQPPASSELGQRLKTPMRRRA
jgi:hypothetical protein